MLEPSGQRMFANGIAMADDDDQCGISTLLKYVAPEHKDVFVKYVAKAIEEESYAFDSSFLGFISDYIHYAEILHRKADIHEISFPFGGDPKSFRPEKPPITVYDVGCAHAFQHVVFDSRIHYVGIDMSQGPEPQFFRPNCRFIRGRFTDVVDQLKVHPDDVGIANMSLLYYFGAEELPAFDRVFKRKFVL